MHNAGVKHSLSVYTLKKIFVVGFLHQVLADILCVKMALGPFIEVFILFTKARLSSGPYIILLFPT